MYEQYHPLGIVGVISALIFLDCRMVMECNAGIGMRRRSGVKAEFQKVICAPLLFTISIADAIKNNNVPEGVVILCRRFYICVG